MTVHVYDFTVATGRPYNEVGWTYVRHNKVKVEFSLNTEHVEAADYNAGLLYLVYGGFVNIYKVVGTPMFGPSYHWDSSFMLVMDSPLSHVDALIESAAITMLIGDGKLYEFDPAVGNWVLVGDVPCGGASFP